jgi:hypothetical protein
MSKRAVLIGLGVLCASACALVWTTACPLYLRAIFIALFLPIGIFYLVLGAFASQQKVTETVGELKGELSRKLNPFHKP